MPTITQGVTFEAQALAATLDEGYQALVHDPLWMLARQWQFDEFQGQDNGTPARVSIVSDQLPLTRYRTGATASPYDPTALPLETLVERESVGAATSRPLLALAEAGQHFLRLLVANGAGSYQNAYRSRYALGALSESEAALWDAGSLQSRHLLTGRVPNAVQLHQELTAALGVEGNGSTLPALPVIVPADQAKVRTAARAWIQWFATQGFSIPTETAAWVPERMEYTFTVAARSNEQEVLLNAPEYHGERMDWDTFDGAVGSSLGGNTLVRTTTQQLLPAPVVYRGMPHSRLWEFEDGRVNLGAVDDGEPDLATLVLLEFALVYGNDWFMAPMEVEVGALNLIKTLKVSDSFGIEQTIQHYSQVDGTNGAWRMYALSPQATGANTSTLRQSLFLAPSIGTMLEGPTLEEVLFLRDEMANMAWAVERVIAGQAGQPLNRYEHYQATRQAEPTPPNQAGAGSLADLAYKLGTTVPDYWIPLLPQAETLPNGQLALRLRRGAMPRFGPGGITGTIPPLGKLLRPGQPLALYEEEVPREGIRVTRAPQYTRWIGGTTHLWLGNEKQPGRGEGSSGLRFDTVEQI